MVGFAEGSTIDAGTAITFSCEEGYELVNTVFQVLSCVSNQFYEPNELPRCREKDVKCEVPILLNGYYNGYNPLQFILKVCNPLQFILKVCNPLQCILKI